MTSNIASVKKLTTDAQSDCKGISKEINNIIKQIQNSKTNAISAISICANHAKKNYKERLMNLLI